MKISIVLFITTAMNGAMAQFQYTACGYHLVNGGSKYPAHALVYLFQLEDRILMW